MNFIIERTSEKINSTAGNVLIGRVLDRTSLDSEVNKLYQGRGIPEILNSEVFRSYIGIIAQGRNQFNDIEQFRRNEFFHDACGVRRIPSEGTLRQRLESMPHEAETAFEKVNHELLSSCSFGTVKGDFGNEYIPWDCDVSPMENARSNKEHTGRTYKGYDGYAPMLSYLGTEGFMQDCELRPGTQHCQKHTMDYLKRNLAAIEKMNLSQRILLRLDSGNDAKENIAIIYGRCDFIIKRNLRRECREQWLALARRSGTAEKLRDGKWRYIGCAGHLHPGNDKNMPTVNVVFEVIETTETRDAQPLLLPDVKVNTYWTSVGDSPETVIELYHDHGTSEQYHSELKTDLDMERLPSGSFKVNSLILKTAMLAYNAIKKIGQCIMHNRDLAPVRITVRRQRIATIIKNMIFIAAKYVKRSNRRFIKFGRDCPWVDVFRSVYDELAA